MTLSKQHCGASLQAVDKLLRFLVNGVGRGGGIFAAVAEHIDRTVKRLTHRRRIGLVLAGDIIAGAVVGRGARSEERRVGKECAI